MLRKIFLCVALSCIATACRVMAPPTSRAPATQPPVAPVGLHARCANALVVGLQWTSSSDDSKVAGYRVSRDGATLGTALTPEFVDTAVSAATTYRYTVSAYDAAGNEAISAPLAVTTAAASARGDAPYCQSPVFASMTWHWSKGYTQANGSDLWSTTWGKDGNVYTFFGDGGGFGGTGSVGRSSFGIAMIAAPPPLQPSALFNVYGGHDALHPARLTGKASSIIAVGADFYAIAGVFRSTDTVADYPHKPSGSPNRLQIAYSRGNAWSWRVNSHVFCSADAAGETSLREARSKGADFCPHEFVGYGKGNAGAPDGYVYILGGLNSSAYWRGGLAPLPARTYLARVRAGRLLQPAAMRFFSGLDGRGKPVWSASSRRMQPIFSDGNAYRPGCGNSCNMAGALAGVVYNAALKRYIGVAQSDYLGQTSFYDAPQLWGPWTVISYNNIDPGSGSGGWGNLGRAAGDALGVNQVNAWTSSDGRTLWMIYSSNGRAPEDALFPPAGTALDSFNLVSVELN